MRLAALASVALLGLSCSTVTVVRAAPANLQRSVARVDWPSAGAETVDLLSAYLKVDTRNPPGLEAAGVAFLRAALEREGIPSEIHEFAPGRASLVARLKATGLAVDKPICLLSHVDVVPAEDAEWPADAQPFSGAIKDGAVWGRGALDMKGMGALELMTMVLLKRQGLTLKRDVILLAVADEELGNRGIRQVVSDPLWGTIDCGVLINEGGVGLKGLLFEHQTAFPITVAEKGTLWLKLVARGDAGHGSTPVPTRAPARLARAVARLHAREPSPHIHAALYELLARAGAQGGGVTGFIMQHPTLVDALALKRLMDKPPTRAAITNTCQVTGYEGKGSAPNVVPSEVVAYVDCRVLPGTKPTELLEELKQLLAVEEGVHLEVLAQSPATESTWDDPFFDALVRALQDGRSDVVAGPAISPGFTDSNLVRPRGTHAYGLVPFEIDAELLGTMHGKNERVPVSEVHRGLKVLYQAVVEASVQLQ